MVIDVVAHTDLAAGDVARLRRLFDAQYDQGFGEWDPDLPYGYAPHDLHVIARQEDEVVGHVDRRDALSVSAVVSLLLQAWAECSSQTMREAGD